MNTELGHSRLSHRGQIVIPKKVKEKLKVHDGEYIIFYDGGDGRIYVKVGVLKPVD